MAEICQKVRDGFERPVEWALSIVVPIFKGNNLELQLLWSCEAS